MEELSSKIGATSSGNHVFPEWFVHHRWICCPASLTIMISQVLVASDSKRIYCVIVLVCAVRAGLHIHDGTGLPVTSPYGKSRFKATSDSSCGWRSLFKPYYRSLSLPSRHARQRRRATYSRLRTVGYSDRKGSFPKIEKRLILSTS
jgi:hypothetical protein